MRKKYIIFRKIVNWLEKNNFFKNSIARKFIAVVLGIDNQSIVTLSVRNGCINIITNNYFYKSQLYGNNIKKDLMNRKLFFQFRLPLVSPVKVHRKIPLTIMMPILKKEIANEETACCILDKLKDVGFETTFKMSEYPLVMDGLKVLENCDCKKMSKRLRKYLQGQEGVIVCAGIVHGDFHRNNIMYRDKTPVLIDFDCSRKNDIQAVDALYYILEEIRYKHGYKKSWLDEWLYIYQNTDIMYEHRCIEQIDIDFKLGLIVLLLERISQDQEFDPLFAEMNKNIIKKISYCLYK